MNNQQNNWFRNPQGDIQGATKQQNSSFGQVQQQGANNNSLSQNQRQTEMSYNNIPQNNGAYYAETQMNEIVKKNKRLKMVIIALVCAVVLALAVVVVVLLMNGDDEQTQNSGSKNPRQNEIGSGEASVGIKNSGGEKPGLIGSGDGDETDPSDGYNIGDYIIFGKYEQDNNENNGKEDIEWLVIDKQDGKLLVISKDILSTARFISNSQYANNKWAKWDESQIRKEMNVDFYNAAFNDDEKAMINVTKVSAGKNPYYGVEPGGATEDKLFLLSIDEVVKYFPSENDRKSSMSSFVKESRYSPFASMWCTRTPGRSNATAVAVSSNDGSILYEGAYSLNYIGFRPAMWIELSE